MPQRAGLEVKEHDGNVELKVTIDNEEPRIIVLDGMTARAIGDQMFRAGCNTGM